MYKRQELPLSCISENALYKSRKGEIFIGGTTGMISFQEKDLEQAPRSYRILPYRLTVNGENTVSYTHLDVYKRQPANLSLLIL